MIMTSVRPCTFASHGKVWSRWCRWLCWWMWDSRLLPPCSVRARALQLWEPGCHQAQTTYRHNVSCLKAATRQGNEQQAWLFPPSLISTLAVFYRKYQIVKQFSLLALFGSSSTSPTFCLRNCPADRQWIIEETGCLLVSAITIAA